MFTNMGGKIRVDYRTGREVIFSNLENDNKPKDFNPQDQKFESDILECPFEYGKESLNKTVLLVGGDESSWKLKVIENKFPILSPESDFLPEKGFLEEKPSFGYCEVIIETPKHDIRLSDFNKEDYIRWIDTIIERENFLYSRDRIKYVYVFKNEGPLSGASLLHSHSQLMAFEERSLSIKEEMNAITSFLKEGKGKCLYEYAIEHEKDRILYQNNTFIAIAPFGSRFTAESMILPKRHVNHVSLLSEDEKKDFADALEKVLRKNKVLFGKMSYNILFHELKDEIDFHFHVELCPRVWTPTSLQFAGFDTNRLLPEKYKEMFESVDNS